MLEQGSTNALANLQGQQAEAIRALAERIGADSSAAIDETLRTTPPAPSPSSNQPRDAPARADARRRPAARPALGGQRTRRQSRAPRRAHARERAEEQVDNDFSRRMALITESPQLERDRYLEGIRQRRHRHRLGKLPARRPRHLHPPRVRLLDTQDARAVAGNLRGRRRLPRDGQSLHP
jgi:hypothetical protein